MDKTENGEKFMNLLANQIVKYSFGLFMVVLVVVGTRCDQGTNKITSQELGEMVTVAFDNAVKNSIQPELNKISGKIDFLYSSDIIKKSEDIKKQAWKILNDPPDIKPGDVKLALGYWTEFNKNPGEFRDLIDNLIPSMRLINKWKDDNLHLFLN